MLETASTNLAPSAPRAANATVVTLACYLSSLFLGMGFAVIGAASNQIGLRPDQIGVLIASQQAGFAIGVLFSGTCSGRLGPSRVLLGGCLVTAFSLFAFYRTPAFALNALLMAGFGIGMGIFEGTTDALLIELHQEHRARHVNINKLFVTLGATGITVLLMFVQLGWRDSLSQIGVGALLVAAVFAWARVPRGAATTAASPRANLTTPRDRRLVALLFAFGVLIVGVELGTMGYLPRFLTTARAFSPRAAQAALLFFLCGVALGRFLIGLFVRDKGVATVLVSTMFAAGASFGALFFWRAGSDVLAFANVLVAGLCIAGAFPLLVSTASQVFGARAAPAIAIIKLAIPAGGIAIPALVSLIAARTSLAGGLAVFPIAGILAAFVMMTVRRAAR